MEKIKKIAFYITVITICLFTVFPALWMLSTSFKPAKEIYKLEPSFLADEPTFDGYKKMMAGSRNFNMKIWFKNSLIVATATTIFSLIIATLGGYGLSRFNFKGKMTLSYAILITQVLPGSVLIIPLYVVLNNLGLLNKMISIVIAYTTFSLPFCTWTMKGFFDSIPKSLDEAAEIDGCSKMGAFTKIITPLSVPGLVATGLFSFIAGWNEYLFASIFVQQYSKWTLTVGISTSIGQYSTDWSSVMAGSVIITIPIVILFLFLQKFLISGMTAGAVKQ